MSFYDSALGEYVSRNRDWSCAFGLFVTLDELFVEGMVHVTALPSDYYTHDAVSHTMRGDKTGLTFRLAASLQVQVARVDMETRRIDFALLGAKPKKKTLKDVLKKQKKQKKKGRRR